MSTVHLSDKSSAPTDPRDQTNPNVRRSWPTIVAHASAIVRTYATGVTLRQLFYRLVSNGTLPNTVSAYKLLSSYTATARRDGHFPDLIDQSRAIHRVQTWTSPNDARAWLASVYRRDRTEHQPYQLWLGVEKAGMVEQLRDWFDDYGVPIVALGGYTSQTIVDQITRAVDADGRPAILLYGGDFDPSGVDIERDVVARSDCWKDVVRVALTEGQVDDYALPPLPGKATDSRSLGFIAKYGRLVQVELDALDPNVLRALYQDAIDRYLDVEEFDLVVEIETTERAELLP